MFFLVHGVVDNWLRWLWSNKIQTLPVSIFQDLSSLTFL